MINRLKGSKRLENSEVPIIEKMSKRPVVFADYSQWTKKRSKTVFDQECCCSNDDLLTLEGEESLQRNEQSANGVPETTYFCQAELADIENDDITISNDFDDEDTPNTQKFDYDSFRDYDSDIGDDDEWSDSCSDFGDNEDQHHSKPDLDFQEDLYPDAPLKVFEFLLCIAALKLRHKLTAKCIGDILQLICRICLKPHKCPPSYHKFQKSFSGFTIPLKKHFYCSKCTSLVNNTDNNVNADEFLENEEFVPNSIHCECPEKEKKNFFIEVSPIAQLKAFFQRHNFYNKLSSKLNSRNNESDQLSDVSDGAIHKKLFQEKSILSKSIAITFMWYTDGVQIFKSSKFSLWGFFLIILELPYVERFKVENILLIGLWYGEKKPNPNLFLKPLKAPLQSLYRGIKMYVKDLDILSFIRGIILCGTLDLPAKALFLSMIQYNGKFGCQVCKEEGFRVDRTHVYPYKESLHLRTDEETLQHAAQAREIKKPVCGVKGPSIMSKLCYKFLTSTSVDVMHCVFEGVVKRLGQLWFDQKFSGEDFSMSNLVELIDFRLMSIKPPAFVPRGPRPIKTHFQYWKASEYKNWFFYYSIPVLSGILPEEYLEHYKYLVLAIYLLCQRNVTNEAIDFAEKLLREFVSRFQDLYGIKNMSSNVHCLRHLPEVVRRLGPLWATSCFPLEDLNGKLKAMVHSSKAVPLQIVSNLSMHITVYNLKNEWLNENSEAHAFCERLLSPTKKLKLTKISDTLSIVGFLSKLKNDDAQQILMNYNLQGRSIFSFKKLYKDNMLFTSEPVQRDKKTESFFVKFLDESGLCIGLIESFIRVTNCNCKTACICPGSHFAFIKKFNTFNPFRVNVENGNLFFIRRGTESVSEIKLVDVSDLKHVCYHITFGNENTFHVIDPVNTIEFE